MRWLWIWAGLAFAIDQGSKWWVFQGLDLWNTGRVDVLPPFLVFVPGYNTGMNFGLFGDGSQAVRFGLIAIAVVISGALIWWARRSFTKGVEFTSVGMIIGGALANALDRVLNPGVLDFLNMSCCGIQNPYIFNIADIFIFAGAFGLILFAGEKPGKKDA